ncbi:MAG: DNA polymerase, partial [Pseudomonadota bacterium]
HDELVFEAETEEVEATIAVAKRVMEGAAGPALELAVPLVVDANDAANWQEAH